MPGDPGAADRPAFDVDGDRTECPSCGDRYVPGVYGYRRYAGPVAVLNSRLTTSAAETFAMAVRARPGRLSALAFLSVFLCKSVLYGVFVWARRALNS